MRNYPRAQIALGKDDLVDVSDVRISSPNAREFASDEAASKAGYTIEIDKNTAELVNALDAHQKRSLGLRLRNLESAGIEVVDADVHAALRGRKEWRRYFAGRTRGG